MRKQREYTPSGCLREGLTQSRMRLACAVSLAMLWSGCGGGETTRQVLQRYGPQFNERRQQFKNIAGSLPAPGGVQDASPVNLSPRPVYDEKHHSSNNTEIVMYDQLIDPDIRSEGHNRLDLILSGNLLTAMQWTGPKNPMSSEGLDRRSNPDLEQELKQALGEQYLVVLRPVKFVAPVATDENTFTPGTADIEGYIVNLPDQKVVGSFRYTAQSSARVEYSSRKGDTSAARQSQLEEFAYSSLYEDARKKLKPLLEQTTGGTFAID